jgi:hypothetical protein
MIADLAASAVGLTPGEITFTAVLSLTRAAITSDTCCPRCQKRPNSANARASALGAAIAALPRRPLADLRTHPRRKTHADERTSRLHPHHRPVKSPENGRKSWKLRAVVRPRARIRSRAYVNNS